MKRKSLLWKIPLALIGVVLGIVLLLLTAVAVVLYVPSVRQATLEKGVAVANEKTDYDIDLGDLHLSPFHHSPIRFYRAYKGEEDLPVRVEIDSLFVGHRGADTLIYTRALHLAAVLKTKDTPLFREGTGFRLPPIRVDSLLLDHTTFHSDSLIKTVGVDVIVGLLAVSSPEISIAEGRYPLHGLRIHDADVGIDLRPSNQPDTLPKDTTPLRLAFELPDGELRNIHFRLTPLGMGIQTGSLSTDATVDVGANCYNARRLNVGDFAFTLRNLRIPADTIYGGACADIARNLITSRGLHVRSDEIGARADLRTTEMDLNTMRVEAAGDAEFRGSKAQLRASYDIDDEAYDATVHIDRVNLAPFLKDSTPVILAGDLEAVGRGINPNSRAMRSKLKLRLDEAVYGGINASGLSLNAQLENRTVEGNLHLPFAMRQEKLRIRAQTEHQFHVEEFMVPQRMNIVYHAQMQDVQAHVADEDFAAERLTLDFATDSTTALDLNTRGLNLTARTPMHVLRLVEKIQPLLQTASDSAVLAGLTSLQDLTVLDTLRRLIPEINASVGLTHGSPAQPLIERMGLDIEAVNLSLASDTLQTDLALAASIPVIDRPEDSTALRLPAAEASVNMQMTEGQTALSLLADTRLTDGLMSLSGLCTDAALRMDVLRRGDSLTGTGRLTLDSIAFNRMDLGNRAVDIFLASSQDYNHALRADIQADDIPLDIVDGIVQLPDISLQGAVKARASIDGLPRHTDISAEVKPIGVAAEYKPYAVGLSLGETPIIMEHNHVDLNGLPVYGADSTFIALTGGLDLNTMRMDIALAADSFAPVKLPKGGPIPVYGELATDIRGRVTGPLDSIIADVDVTILPTTDITYPIDKKNLAQVKPHGAVNIRYGTAEGALNLGGQINVDDGTVRYSPKIYPVMPFKVDSGSHIAFNGPIGKTQLNVSASQQVKADVESEDEDTRRVDFRTGVRVNGELDSLGLESINFFLEAPKDETITRELASLDEGTREGLAATLLATGMYVGESNVAAQREGYALSSIINSRINAAMANSKIGKFMEVDISSGQTRHAAGKSNDMNIAISKSFFKNRLRITIGSTISDNPEVNKTNGLFSSLTADYRILPKSQIENTSKQSNAALSLRLFSQRDYNNILEGELNKSGLGIRFSKDWRRRELFRGDSISRTYDLTADAGVAYRSNNSIGPDITLKSSIRNLLGGGETFTLKGNGAYYWALRNRHPGDPKKTDTYKLGLNASLIFPYLHWAGENNPEGDTRYMLGYQYENIAGGYGVHKLSGSFTYFIHSANSPYITHAFTPFSLSVVMMKAESENLLDKAAEYPQLIKVIAGDEFVPSIGYNFTYNDYRAKRHVNTMFDLGIKESGNLINALYCIAGYKWNDPKMLGKITFNQFVKLSAELRNKFNLTEQVSIATRLFAGANIPVGNSMFAPLSEAFYAGGPNSMRSASPYAYGPGNFYSAKYNQNFFHAGDIKLEANFELRFPIVWKLYGAAFLDAGNVWNWYSTVDLYKAAGLEDYITRLQIPEDLHDGIFDNPDFARQIALGTGAGLRLDIDGLVVRLDIGVAIHAPYQTFKYTKQGEPDTTQPIKTYYNIPSALDAVRFNFGIGYPF
ncbi:MAG: BamA/TamA family outer membrane protein [Paludibacteraceae bacterium]|nr:BamA/TamA family outer membrane protein [Paludibacteraceae bacterium]